MLFVCECGLDMPEKGVVDTSLKYFAEYWQERHCSIVIGRFSGSLLENRYYVGFCPSGRENALAH